MDAYELATLIAQNHADVGYTRHRTMLLGTGDGTGTILGNDAMYPRAVWAHEPGKPAELVLLPSFPMIPPRNDTSLEGLPVQVGLAPRAKLQSIFDIAQTLDGQQALGSSGVTPFESEHNQLANLLLPVGPANQGLFTPNGVAGQLALRSIVLNDLPTGLIVGQALLAGSTVPAYGALNLAGTSTVSGILGVLYGGTGANLSATGGAHQVVFQTTVGGAFTVAALSSGDLPAGTGTVTSVGLSSDSTWMTIGSSPITTSGTITYNRTTGLTANRFLATPSGATGVVDLRSIVDADLPTALAGHTITGGSIDNTPIGATTRSTGAFSNITITSGGYIRPSSDSTASILWTKADGTTVIGSVDSTNSRFAFGNSTAPSATVHVFGAASGIGQIITQNATTPSNYLEFRASNNTAINARVDNNGDFYANTTYKFQGASTQSIVGDSGGDITFNTAGSGSFKLLVAGTNVLSFWIGKNNISNPAVEIWDSTSTSAAIRILRIRNAATGNGSGPRFTFAGYNDHSNDRDMAYIDCTYTSNVQGSENADLIFQTYKSSTVTELFRLVGNGGTLSTPTTFSKYNNDATAGNGVASNVGRVALTTQTATVTATNIFTPPINGEYEIGYVLTCTTAGTGGTVTVTLTWTDENGSQTFTSATLNLNATGFTNGTIFIHAKTTAAIQYSTTVTGATGSPQYSLYIDTMRVA